MRISVVIPARDSAAYLGEALDSVFAQTVEPFEVVVVDDGSRDETAAIARDFDRVRVIAEQGRGVGAARNRGAAATSGEALAFLDSDDVWEPGKSAAQLPLLVASSGELIIRGEVEQFLSPELDPGQARGAVPEGPAAMITAGAMLIGRKAWELAGPFDEELRMGEMLDWLLRARRNGCKELTVDEVVLRRRVHENNTSLKRQHELGVFAEILKRDLDAKRQASARLRRGPA